MISFASVTARLPSDTFLLVWNIASVVTFLLPLMAFSIARLTSENDENQENDQGDDQNQNNNYSNNYQNPDYYDEYGNYVGPNHWWQFWKSNNNNGQNNDDQEDNSNDERGAPWWYIWGEREGGDPEDEGSGAVRFLYLWTLVSIAALVYVGNKTGMLSVNNLQGLRWALLGFANYCFVIIVLLIGLEGGIETEGREMEEQGFYGQTSVLLLITCIFALVQSIVFISWTTKRLKRLRAEEMTSMTAKSDEYVNIEFENEHSPSGQPPGYKLTI